jgi:hypothetical protein
MTATEPPAQDIPDEEIERFAARLDSFAARLRPREQAALRAVLFRAAPPLQRMRRREETDLLDADERALLEAIEREREQH